jgi:peroxiredoxin
MTTFLTNPMLAPRIDEISLQLHFGSKSSEPALLALSSLIGRVIVLFVFGVDCGTCRHLSGVLSDLRREFSGSAECIGVCIQSGCEERLEAFRAESSLELPLAHSSTTQLCPALHIPRATWLFYPTLIFIDAKQRMRGYVVGGSSFFEDSAANLRKILEDLLHEQREDDVFENRETVEARA